MGLESFVQLEKKRLEAVFSETQITIYHIGRTAIPNILAKPIMDLLITVNNLDMVGEFKANSEKIGYIARGENGIEGRCYFTKGGQERTHHLHIFEVDNMEVERHLSFREYMLAHTEEARVYSELKQRLVREYDGDLTEYIKGKNDFIEGIDKKASDWNRTRK